MTKPIFTDEFKQGVVDYVLEHPDESKVSFARRFGVADSTFHKWVRLQVNMKTIKSVLEEAVIYPVMKLRK